MTKADLVEQVADAVGPRVTKKDCGLVVDALLRGSPARLTGGSAPSTRTDPRCPTGFADCRLSPRWMTHLP